MITYPNVKVNLGLNVLRRRPDGYHDIETLFVPYFGMTDVLEIVPADEFSIRITSSKPGIPDWDPMSDLCAKAWRLMNERFGVGPVAVLLEKRNPVGGGLGGGSSDGAFTLKMLNEIFSLGLAVTELASLAAELGSDCPFFIYNRPMIGEGRGEILSEFDLPDIDLGAETSYGRSNLCSNSDSVSQARAVKDLSVSQARAAKDLSVSQACEAKELTDGVGNGYRLGVIALDSSLKVSTAQAYRSITPSIPEISLRDALSHDITQWHGLLKNDFEPVISAAHPLVRETIEACYARGCVYAAMSGSGPSVYYIDKKR